MEAIDQLKLDISFANNSNLGDNFAIYLKDDIGANYNVIAEFVEIRTRKYQVEQGPNLETTLNNLSKSFQLDYGTSLNINKTTSGISLTPKNGNWQYLESTISPSLPINISPQTQPILFFNITNIEFLEASIDKCNKVKVRITTNQTMTSYCINQVCNVTNLNYIEFEWFRNSTLNIDLVKGASTIQKNIQTPNTIETNNSKISLNIINSISGGSVTIIAPFATQFLHMYSLDNVNWQNSNSFSGLLEGNYTAYVKDKFGCSKSIAFKIQPYENNIISLNNYHYISKANSIRYAHRVDFESNHKTDENTLSCEMDVIKPFKQIQLFKPKDLITTQFKSNYDDNSAYVIHDNNIDFIPITKKTNNIGLKDKRTAIKFNADNGLTGIYFITGNILDYINNSTIGTYELNGYLPEWAKKGNKMQMDNVWYNIVDITFDELRNTDVILINNLYSNLDTATIVAAEYNRENYDVYEFPINMQTYLNKKIRVKIEMSQNSSINESVTYLSEEIHILENIENSLEIRYKNTKNTDILYSTGIEHLLRVSYDINAGKDINTSENHKTDDRAILLDAKIYESNQFKFEPLTKELWRKLKIALSHDTIFIDSVGYIKDEDFETEGPLGQTNLYVLSATMLKTGNVYSKVVNNIITGNEIEMPEIIGIYSIENNGFLKI